MVSKVSLTGGGGLLGRTRADSVYSWQTCGRLDNNKMQQAKRSMLTGQGRAHLRERGGGQSHEPLVFTSAQDAAYTGRGWGKRESTWKAQGWISLNSGAEELFC